MRPFKRCALTLAILLAFYVLSLTLVECIPNRQIDYHVDNGCAQLWEEGSKPTGFGGEAGAQLDNATDVLMLQRAVRDTRQSALVAAMDQQDYARYWHGYLLVLRPLLRFFSYPDIRLINYWAIMLAAFFCVSRVNARLGATAAVGFACSLVMGFISVVPLSMQYVSIFFIAFAACVLLLSPRALPARWGWAPFFLAIGSITNFFDFLTAPLLTLGYPLLLCLLLYARRPGVRAGALVRILLTAGIAWALGYGLTWLAKWLIASAVLGRDVVSEAVASILHRTLAAGDAIEYPLDYRQMLTLNLKNFLPRTARFGVMLLLLACVLRALRRGISWHRFSLALVVLSVAALPYVWFFVLGNHSQVHAWFTYRIQMMSVWSLFGAISVLEKESSGP